MTKYVALLRGVNVGGARKIAMTELRRLCVALGHTDAHTYIQSGNVIFSSSATDESLLAAGAARNDKELENGHEIS